MTWPAGVCASALAASAASDCIATKVSSDEERRSSSASAATSVVESRKSIPPSSATPAWSPSQAPTSHTASTASPTNGRSVSQSSASVYALDPLGTRDREVEGRLQVTPFPFRRPRGLARFVGRDEVHQLGEVVGPEQLHRVDVAVAEAQPEVEHSPVVVAVVVGARPAGGAEHVAARHRLPGAHRDRGEERVRRS